MTTKFLRDLAERALATFVEGFITILIALPFLADVVAEGSFDLDTGKRVLVSALAGGVMSALATVKAILARRTGNPDSASAVNLDWVD